MKRLVIFDLDGTLINTISDLAHCTNHVLLQNHYPEHELSRYPYFVGNGITKLIERALPPEARTSTIISTVKAQFIAYYHQHKTDFSHPYPHIPGVLAELKNKGILLAVASNKYQAGTTELVEHFFGKHLFSVIFGQRDQVPVKPDPCIVFDILKQTGMKPSLTLYIGDSGVDMHTARNGKLTSVGVTWGFRSRQELEENGADYIIDQPQQILELLSI